MNQSPGKVPDPHRTLQDAIQARQQTPSTEEAQEEEEDPSKPGRADRIAALEADAETTAVKTITGADGKEIPVYRRPERQDEVMEIRKQAPVDPKEAGTILDRPPVAGVNPRFKPPPKL